MVSAPQLCYKTSFNGIAHSSTGSAPAPCVEAIVLVAGHPGSNLEPSGLILRVIPPLSACFLSLSTVLYIKGKKAQKKNIYINKTSFNDTLFFSVTGTDYTCLSIYILLCEL